MCNQPLVMLMSVSDSSYPDADGCDGSIVMFCRVLTTMDHSLCIVTLVIRT